ncbi:uncharacterized protein LOC112575347 [Pomacea canaliculata]|uniref:uncharacterized protein LOC112575347 n=1 Tax=Pomacea canaliculata TaxID=400727 RepID=UPI000D72E19C|nr:uncharacterized protein LOC112575347 [Pomacea canaliculata]
MARMTGLSVVCLLLSLVLSSPVQGKCYIYETYIDGPTGMPYCLAENQVLYINQWAVTPECYNCTCQEKKMTCCAVGVKASAIAPPPPGYKIQMMPPCSYTFVPRTSEDFNTL